MAKREPKPTGRYYFTTECPRCHGSGRVRHKSQSGKWHIEYHYQDGHELSHPMTKEEAIKDVTQSMPSVMKTLIGPDGQIYTI